MIDANHRLPTGWTDDDLVFSNLIRHPGGAAYLIDWEHAGVRPVVAHLAKLAAAMPGTSGIERVLASGPGSPLDAPGSGLSLADQMTRSDADLRRMGQASDGTDGDASGRLRVLTAPDVAFFRVQDRAWIRRFSSVIHPLPPQAPGGAIRRFLDDSPTAAIAVVATVGLVISLTASWWLWSVEQTEAGRVVQTRAEVVARSIESGLGGATIRLASIAGLYQASAEVSELEFRRFVRKMGLVPGVLAIGYMPVITDRNVKAFEASMRRTRPGFEVFEFDALARQVPAESRRVHAPIQWYEPEAAFSDAEGFDSLSDPRRATAMEIARLTRSLAISPYIRLIGNVDNDGVVMYWPVTDSESEALIGYAMAALDLGVMMDQALADAVAPSLTWHLLDVTHVTEEFDPAQPGAKTIEIGGRTWRLVVRPEPGSGMEPNPRTPILLLGTGLLATAFVAGALSNRRRNRNANREYEKLRELTIAKDQFLASVGHELRTPLTSVLGFAELLRTESDGLTDDDRRAMISSVAAEATDLAAIVDDLLVAARSELDLLVVTSVPVAARAQVNQVLEAHRRYDSEMIEVVCEPDQPYRALGDPSRVRQILRNLVTNACRYGGRRIEVRLTADAEWVRIVVADDGAGVPEGHSESIFDPYYRAHSIESQPAALGIGLSVARQLAVLMKGDLSYRRDQGWTVFELTLPTSPDTSPPSRVPHTTRNSDRLPTRVA